MYCEVINESEWDDDKKFESLFDLQRLVMLSLGKQTGVKKRTCDYRPIKELGLLKAPNAFTDFNNVKVLCQLTKGTCLRHIKIEKLEYDVVWGYFEVTGITCNGLKGWLVLNQLEEQ